MRRVDLSDTVASNGRITFFLSILLAYKNFSLSYNMQKTRSSGESWVLFLCLTSALILFLANLPYQIALFPSSSNDNIILYISLLCFVSAFFMPLFLYLFSAGIFIVCKIFNGQGSFYEVSLALFWSINVAAPILIMNGFLKGFFFESPKIGYVNLVLESAVAWVFSSMMAEAEQFSSKYLLFLISVCIIFMPKLMMFF